MPAWLTRRTFEIGAIVVALALLAVMGWRLSQAHGLLLIDGNPVFGDFIAFWSAGKLALEGQANLVHDVALITAVQHAAVPGMHLVAPWNSPPYFLLIATALALLPYPAAALTWLAASGALYLFAARKILPDARALLIALTAPAALYHIGSVQTGLAIAGVTGLALIWLDTRPRAAGALIALLAIKPHLAVLWPIYLAFTGRWRVFAAASVTFAVFTFAAGLAFGWDTFAHFVQNLSAASSLIGDERVPPATFGSLFGNLTALGAPRVLAIGAHALSAIAAIAAAIYVFRRGDARAQGAALCAATLLISPYLFFYDFTLLLVGAALLAPARDRFELIALMVAWGAGLSLAISELVPLPLCPLAAWLVLACAIRRARSAASRLAPAPRT